MVKITDTDTVVLVKNNGEVSVLKMVVKAVKAVYSEDRDTLHSFQSIGKVSDHRLIQMWFAVCQV